MYIHWDALTPKQRKRMNKINTLAFYMSMWVFGILLFYSGAAPFIGAWQIAGIISLKPGNHRNIYDAALHGPIFISMFIIAWLVVRFTR